MTRETSPEVIDLGAGLGFAVAPENSIQVFNVADRTELAVNTYQALGMVPDSAKASELISQQMQVLHDALSADQGPDTLAVETFKPVDFVGKFTLDGLVAAYNRMQRKDGTTPPETYVWSDLWKQYDASELNRRLFDGSDQPVAASHARAMLLGGDKPNVPGLYFTGQTLKDQIKSAKAFMSAYRLNYANTNGAVMNTADLVIVNAQRQVEGRDLLDKANEYTFSRVPQLGDKSVRGYSVAGSVDSGGARLRLRGSYGRASSDAGVRLSVGPKA